jgi:phosphohistidine phosphatase
MRLYIVRHAWAEEADANRWPDDGDRPLTAAGRKRFARLVTALGASGFLPELVVTSPLVRCRETAELIQGGLSSRPRIIDRDELAPYGDLDGLLAWFASEASRFDSAAWVGHAPDVGDIAAALIGDGSACIHFSKGAVAAIDFPTLPARNAGELVWLVTAKALGC